MFCLGLYWQIYSMYIFWMKAVSLLHFTCMFCIFCIFWNVNHAWINMNNSTWPAMKYTFLWWRLQMGTFSALLALCAGKSPVPVNSPHKGQWRGALMFSFICAWINDWVNNREAGDLRRHRGHYGVIVILKINSQCRSFSEAPTLAMYFLHGFPSQRVRSARLWCLYIYIYIY